MIYRIMVVDDEPNVLKALKRDLRGLELDVEYYSEVASALRRCESAVFDVVMADFRMPEIDGITFLTAVKALQPDTIRMVLSGEVDAFTLLTAINEVGLYRYLVKPWDAEALRHLLKEACAICGERKQQRHFAAMSAKTEVVTLASKPSAKKQSTLLTVRRNDDDAIELD
jgi:two-component system, probable response regulator PhcQ